MTDGHPPARAHPAQPSGPRVDRGAAGHQHSEVELKFEAGPDFALPRFAQVPGVTGCTDPRQLQLAATYYDTHQLDLLAAKVTLRRRTGGDDPGWHLKLPASDGERTELTVELDEEPAQGYTSPINPIPDALHQVIRGIARGRSLQPVATLRTHRTVVRLQDSQGRSLVEVAEDLVETGTGGTWREFEIEVIEGTRVDLQYAAQALVQAGARPSRSPSKLGQALVAAGHGPPSRPSLAGFSRRSPAIDVLAAHLHHQRDALVQAELALRLDRDHSCIQAIDAARRLLTTFRLFRSIIGPIDKSSAGMDLRDLIRQLVALEDIRSQRRRIGLSLLEEPPAFALATRTHVDTLLCAQEAVSRNSIDLWLSGDRTANLLRNIDIQLGAIAGTEQLPVFRVMPQILGAAWRRADRKVGKVISQPSDAKQVKQAIRACRDLRLGAELASSAMGSNLVVIAAAVEQVEETLTDQHQALCGAGILVELATATETSGPAAFTLGRIHSFELASINDTVDEVTDAWERAREITSLRHLN